MHRCGPLKGSHSILRVDKKLCLLGEVIYCQLDALTFKTKPFLNYVFNFMFQNKKCEYGKSAN